METSSFILLVFLYLLSKSVQYGDGDNAAIEWECKNINSSTLPRCYAVVYHHHFHPTRPGPLEVTFEDRINPVGWRHLAELWVADPRGNVKNLENEYFRDPLECYLSCLKPLTVVHVCTAATTYFFKSLVPLVNVPIILLTTDFDDPNPNKHFNMNDTQSIELYREKFPVWYMTNCLPRAVELSRQYPEWITCVPIGLNQLELGFSRFLVNNLLNQRYGNYRRPLSSKDVDSNRIYDEIRARKVASTSNATAVMISMSVGNNKEARLPVKEYFCGNSSNESLSPFNQLGGAVAQCISLSPVRYYQELIKTYHFAVSPLGNGFDCYRTYEILFMGSYPIVRTSHIDILYEGWPVLIVQDWTDVTPALLNDTFHKFVNTEWDLSRLYFSYWQHHLYTRRKQLGGPWSKWKYFAHTPPALV